jgi:beta-glucosidase
LSSNTFTNKITATINITNAGKTAGKEVVELYISAPGKKLDKPSEELKGFAKTKLLQPNESQTVTFTIDARSLASYDTKAAAWVAEAGKYTAKVGKSCMLIQQTRNFNLSKNITVQQLTNLLVPQVSIKELKQ